MVARERRDLLRVVDDEHRPPELRLGGLLVDLEHELAGAVVVLHLDAVLGGDAAQLVDRHAHVDADAGVLLDQVDEAGPPPRRGEVELAAAVGELGRAVELLGEVGGELLGERHHVRVVAVGLVELEHRELGVVAGGQALVAEHPPDLEHPLEAADGEALQVELRRDPQEELHVERVVVRGERLGQRAAGDRVEDRRLHLDEARGPRASGA